MNSNKYVKKIRECDIDISGNGANLSLDEAKSWIHRVQPLLKTVPHIYNAFSRLAIIVLQADREDSRILNHLKTMNGYTKQAATEIENGSATASDESGRWHSTPLGKIAMAVVSGVLVALAIYLINKYTGLGV